MTKFLILGLTLMMLCSCQKVPSSTGELPKDGASLTLYFIPSPFGINWESPRKLFTSITLNYFSFKPHFMGHVAVQVSCHDLDQKQHNFLTGMSPLKLEATKSVFMNHAGLGVMFEKHPGKFDDPNKSERELIYRLKNPGETSGVNFVQFKINSAACTRIVKYFEEFKQHDINRYYALYSRPLYGEGAGCSAFGASFLELIGVMNEDLKKEWSYNLQLPLELIGHPYINQNVYFWSLFFANTWGIEGEKSLPFFFWEPDKMYHWVNTILKNNTPHGKFSNFKPSKIFNSPGLIFDARLIAVPSEPIWKKTDRPFFSELLELNKQLYQSSL